MTNNTNDEADRYDFYNERLNIMGHHFVTARTLYAHVVMLMELNRFTFNDHNLLKDCIENNSMAIFKYLLYSGVMDIESIDSMLSCGRIDMFKIARDKYLYNPKDLVKMIMKHGDIDLINEYVDISSATKKWQYWYKPHIIDLFLSKNLINDDRYDTMLKKSLERYPEYIVNYIGRYTDESRFYRYFFEETKFDICDLLLSKGYATVPINDVYITTLTSDTLKKYVEFGLNIIDPYLTSIIIKSSDVKLLNAAIKIEPKMINMIKYNDYSSLVELSRKTTEEFIEALISYGIPLQRILRYDLDIKILKKYKENIDIYTIGARDFMDIFCKDDYREIIDIYKPYMELFIDVGPENCEEHEVFCDEQHARIMDYIPQNKQAIWIKSLLGSGVYKDADIIKKYVTVDNINAHIVNGCTVGGLYAVLEMFPDYHGEELADAILDSNDPRLFEKFINGHEYTITKKNFIDLMKPGNSKMLFHILDNKYYTDLDFSDIELKNINHVTYNILNCCTWSAPKKYKDAAKLYIPMVRNHKHPYTGVPCGLFDIVIKV